jgi:hypothetical protein
MQLASSHYNVVGDLLQLYVQQVPNHVALRPLGLRSSLGGEHLPSIEPRRGPLLAPPLRLALLGER